MNVQKPTIKRKILQKKSAVCQNRKNLIIARELDFRRKVAIYNMVFAPYCSFADFLRLDCESDFYALIYKSHDKQAFNTALGNIFKKLGVAL